MKKFLLVTAVMVCVATVDPVPAFAQDGGSVTVAVNLIPLQKGSLPTSVTTYGRVVPSQKARETLFAPVASQASNVEVREGEMVSKGAPLLTLVPSPETRSSYKQAEQALSVAQRLVVRSRRLAKAHLETEAQLAQDEKAEADAKAALDALREVGAGGPSTLTAPFDAVVMNIAASSGMYLAQGAPVIELAHPAGLVFRTGVVPAQVAEIKIGDEATITPFSGSGTFHGQVVLRGAVVSMANGLIPIEISLPDSSMLTGEMGKVVINTGISQGYIVPHEAVLLNTSGQTYIVQSVHGIARLITVTVTASRGDKDLVQGDVVDGAPVVGTGNYQLDNGTRLQVTGDREGTSGSSGNSATNGKQ